VPIQLITMKSTFSYLAIACFLLAACNKDSVNTKPSLTLKSVSPDVVAFRGNMRVAFTFGDKESDIDSLFIFRKRLNIKTVTTLRDTIGLKVADYDKNTTGEINIDFTYDNYLISALNPPTSGTPARKESDTLSYKFFVKDKQKNVSDTVYYSPIVILRQ